MRRSKIAGAVVAASLLCAGAGTATAQDAAAGKAKAGQCFTCHGADGIAKTPDAPNLAGQNEAYLVKALTAYKTGARQDEVMSLMAKNLSAQDIRQVTAYFSSIPISVKAP